MSEYLSDKSGQSFEVSLRQCFSNFSVCQSPGELARMLLPIWEGVGGPRVCTSSSFQVILLLLALTPFLCTVGLWYACWMVCLQDRRESPARACHQKTWVYILVCPQMTYATSKSCV